MPSENEQPPPGAVESAAVPIADFSAPPTILWDFSTHERALDRVFRAEPFTSYRGWRAFEDLAAVDPVEGATAVDPVEGSTDHVAAPEKKSRKKSAPGRDPRWPKPFSVWRWKRGAQHPDWSPDFYEALQAGRKRAVVIALNGGGRVFHASVNGLGHLGDVAFDRHWINCFEKLWECPDPVRIDRGDTVALRPDVPYGAVVAWVGEGYLDRFMPLEVDRLGGDYGQVVACNERGERFYVASDWLCHADIGDLNARRAALLDRPLDNSEQRRLAKARPLLSELAQLTRVAQARIERKYVGMLRGVIASDDEIPARRFLTYLRQLRAQRQCDFTESDAEGSWVERTQRAMQGPPTAWPRPLDRPGNMVGIEIEFLTPRRGYTRPQVTGMHIGYDGSVSSHDENYNSGEGGKDSEARLAFPFGRWGRLKRACAALRAQGCIVNDTCGLHVHLDVRGLSAGQRRDMTTRLACALPLFNTLVPERRVLGDWAERYCRNAMSYDNRYSAINANSIRQRETIEIRMFSGTIDDVKIRHWVELLWWVSRQQAGSRLVRSLDDFLGSEAPDHLKDWVRLRVAQMNDAHAGVEVPGLELSEC